MKVFYYFLLSGFLFSGSLMLGQQYQRPVDTDSLITACMADVNADSVENYLHFLQDMGTRFLLDPNRKANAEAIQSKFMQLGASDVRIDSFLCTTTIDMWNLHFDTITWQYNVIARLEGMTDANQLFVMGAHWDDVVSPEGDPMIFAPGADDNASGVAALFECFRVLSLHNFTPVYDFEFVAFAAEELMYFGHSGAQAYVDTALAKGVNMELMINNDMIGYTGSEEWELAISNYIGSEWITYIAEEITLDYTEIDPYIRPPSGQGGADCKYFFEAGVPCLYFMEKDFNPHYHTVEDLVENCDINYTTEAIKVSLGSIIKASNYVLTPVEENKEVRFSVYPNPTNADLHIRPGVLQHSTLEFELFNIYGSSVLKSYGNGSGSQTLHLSGISPGMYILIISDGISRIWEETIVVR